MSRHQIFGFPHYLLCDLRLCGSIKPALALRGLCKLVGGLLLVENEATDMPSTEVKAHGHIYHLLAQELIPIEPARAEIDQRSPTHT